MEFKCLVLMSILTIEALLTLAAPAPILKEVPSIESRIKEESYYFVRKYIQSRYDATADDQGPDSAGLLLQYLDGIAYEKMVFGLRILFDEMRQQNNMDGKYIMHLALRVAKALEWPKQTENTKEDLMYISENLPRAIRDFPYNKPLRFQNMQRNKFLTATETNDKVNFTISIEDKCEGSECQWIIVPVMNYTVFLLKNAKYTGNLFADAGSIKIDGNEMDMHPLRLRLNEKKVPSAWYLVPTDNFELFGLYNAYWYYDCVVAAEKSTGAEVYSSKLNKCDTSATKWKLY